MISQHPGPTGPLRVIAWIALAGGVLGAAILWSAASSTTVSSDFSVEEETNPVAIAMGFFVMLQGVLAWAALMVFASMGENVALIASHTGRAAPEAPPEPEPSPAPEPSQAPEGPPRDGWGRPLEE